MSFAVTRRGTMLAARAARSSGRVRGLHPCPLVSTLQWRSFSDSSGEKPPTNPFEIQLDLPEKDTGSSQTLSLVEVERAAAQQQQDVKRDIELLHEEMSNLFGEELSDHDANGQRANDNAPFEAAPPSDASPRPQKSRASSANKRPKTEKETARIQDAPRGKVSKKSEFQNEQGKKPHVLVVDGPCSFVRGHWARGALDKKAHRNSLSHAADQLGLLIKQYDNNSEAKILDLLLKTDSSTIVVLSWNTRLDRSPHVVRALELIESRVIIVSPMGVEHGPLPPNVVGVLSGLGGKVINLALQAAKDLTKQQ